MTSDNPQRPGGEPRPGEEPEDEGVRVTDRRRIDPETGEVRAPGGQAPEPQGPEAGTEPTGPATPGPATPGPATSGPATPGPAAAPVDPAEAALAEAEAAVAGAESDHIAELTADLQRLAAEYKNYRDRMQRDIADAYLRGQIEVVTGLIATLDDLDRAAAHGDLTGPAKALADNLLAALAKLRVERFGEVGQLFDPAQHEALTHGEGEGYDVPTVTAVYQPGYRLGERVIRPARVGVTE